VSTTERRRRARRGEGDKLRAEIVDAASRMLARTGEVGELSLRAVAREVGVAATSIYLHFENLDELVLAVKLRYFDQFGAVLDAAADAAGDQPIARASARGHAYVRFGLENVGLYRALFMSEMLPPHLMPDAGFIGAGVFEAARRDIADVVGPDVDAHLLAVHFWTALHGVVTLRTVRRNFPWPDLEVQLDDLIARLIQ
jgi:AcrR family transcriptional regulator